MDVIVLFENLLVNFDTPAWPVRPQFHVAIYRHVWVERPRRVNVRLEFEHLKIRLRGTKCTLTAVASGPIGL